MSATHGVASTLILASFPTRLWAAILLPPKFAQPTMRTLFMEPEDTVMPTSTKRAAHKTTHASRSQSNDAISLLKADHRQVEEWFEEFENSRSEKKKQQLANDICSALTVHTTIEEEIFYPAFLEATEDKDIHNEAVVEHDAAKRLIREIQAMAPDDDYFDAKVSVLSEMIKHHVKEEEKTGGMFAEARKSDMDLKAIGDRLLARKNELRSNDKSADKAA
jgi:hemerythrin superfamily protein